MPDYGMGKTNIDTENGTRYGVIPSNKVREWTNVAEPGYPELDREDYSSDEEYEHFLDSLDPEGWYLDDGEYKAVQHGDSPYIMVTKSPYYTLCRYCSPCFPGAGDLNSEGDVKTYCFGHDWFDGDKAPYPVYSVATNQMIPYELKV